jgi:hypothetical protein
MLPTGHETPADAGESTWKEQLLMVMSWEDAGVGWIKDVNYPTLAMPDGTLRERLRVWLLYS